MQEIDLGACQGCIEPGRCRHVTMHVTPGIIIVTSAASVTTLATAGGGRGVGRFLRYFSLFSPDRVAF